MEELKCIVNDNSIDIVGITETWATSGHTDAEFEIQGYNLYRKDHLNGHGGVIMYVRDGIESTICESLTSSTFEDSIWCLVNIGHNDQMLLGTVYRSSNSTVVNDLKLLELLEKSVTLVNVTCFTIMGDFNLPEIDYEHFAVKGDENSYQSKFFETTQDLFFVQNVFGPTRIRQGQIPSKLDYIFTQTENDVDQLRYLAPLGLSNHVGLA
jgi:hypothetical protein